LIVLRLRKQVVADKASGHKWMSNTRVGMSERE
jgi:hypothetical protein